MADDPHLVELTKDLETRVSEFEAALRDFVLTKAWASQSHPHRPRNSNQEASANDLPPPPRPGDTAAAAAAQTAHIPPSLLRSLFSNLVCLKRDLSGLQIHLTPVGTGRIREVRHRHPLPPTTAPDAAAAAATEAFLVAVEGALESCDIDSPGSRTAPPHHPSLAAIRQSREACRAVWSEFYLTRHTPLSPEMRRALRSPAFDNWPFSDAQLLRFVRFFFTGDYGLETAATTTVDDDGGSEAVDDRLCLARWCDIPESLLDAWLCAVYAKYNCVCFHNFKHAFMVSQMMYASICSADLASLFCHLDLFTLLFSAICHDLDHPGLTNAYQNNAQTQLSICYNTLSPLENHHCSVAFELIRTPATNIFVNFADKDFEMVRQNAVRCILGTDMAKHTDILEAFTGKMVEHSTEAELNGSAGVVASSSATSPRSSGASDSSSSRLVPTLSQLSSIFEEDDESHTLTMVVLLKMCDISTEIRPDEVARPWLNGLIGELSRQRELERKTNLPLSPVMDEGNLVQCQINFLTFAMLPLAEALISVIPALENCFLRPTQSQLAHYRQLVAEKAASVKPTSSTNNLEASGTMDDLLEPKEAVVVAAEALEEGKEDDLEEQGERVQLELEECRERPNNSSLEAESGTGARFDSGATYVPIENDELNGTPVVGVKFHSTATPPSSCLPPAAVSTSPESVLGLSEAPGHPAAHRHLPCQLQHQLLYQHQYSLPHHHNNQIVCQNPSLCQSAHKRTSIVSSAGLISAELLTPMPHRPLRRSLGELPWSSHALLLAAAAGESPNTAGGYRVVATASPLVQPNPPPPPPRANRVKEAPQQQPPPPAPHPSFSQ